MSKSLVSIAIAFILGFTGIFIGLTVYQKFNPPLERPNNLPGLLWPKPKALTDFSLLDQDATVFDRRRIQGKWTFWYFGYTNCPDACPMALTTMRALSEKLEMAGEVENFQFSFVSVDPKRDTLDHLKKYVSFFDESFVAVTGDTLSLKRLTSQFGVLHVYGEEGEDGNYLVDHTTAYLLTDPSSRFVGLFRQPHDVNELFSQFLDIKKFLEDIGT